MLTSTSCYPKTDHLLRVVSAAAVRSNRKGLVGVALCAAALLASVLPADALAKWVIRGRGWGHGGGMSQYGAYGFAKHGRGYKEILHHYYRRTKVGHADGHDIRVLLDAGRGSVAFTRAKSACGKDLRPSRDYRFDRSGSDVVLRAAGGRKLRGCGGTGTARGDGGVIRIRDFGAYRGKLRAKASGGGLLVINVVGLEGYTQGVIPSEMPSSWPQAALRAQAVAARSYAVATSGGGSFDVYDDTRSQVYGGKGSETQATNAAASHSKGEVVKHSGNVATTYYFSTSGGRTESIQFAFPGADPVPYLKSVRDPYDDTSPYHKWRVVYSQGQMESRLSGLFSGNLRKIDVTKRGVSPRIVYARVVGSGGSSRVNGLTLQGRLDLRSTWAHFEKR
jgi:stage II sporulation protein D